MESFVRITLNGEQKELPGPLSVAELVRHLGLKAEHVAVELNKGLVTRSRHAQTPVAEGDVLEVVTLVGGGSRCAAAVRSRSRSARICFGAGCSSARASTPRSS